MNLSNNETNDQPSRAIHSLCNWRDTRCQWMVGGKQALMDWCSSCPSSGEHWSGDDLISGSNFNGLFRRCVLSVALPRTIVNIMKCACGRTDGHESSLYIVVGQWGLNHRTEWRWYNGSDVWLTGSNNGGDFKGRRSGARCEPCSRLWWMRINSGGGKLSRYFGYLMSIFRDSFGKLDEQRPWWDW